MTGTILLIIALFVGALLLFAAEVCTPTFGVLAATALGCLVGMVYLSFTINPTFGVVMIVVLVFLLPVYLWAMIKYLPQTPVGRILQLRAEPKDPGEGTPNADILESLVGMTVVAETPLRPSGAIRAGNRRIIATAEAGFIDKGAKVKIIKAGGTDVIVREVEQKQEQT